MLLSSGHRLLLYIEAQYTKFKFDLSHLIQSKYTGGKRNKDKILTLSARGIHVNDINTPTCQEMAVVVLRTKVKLNLDFF